MICGSLFSGVGGLDLGLAQAGWSHAFFAEVNPYARAVLKHHWPSVPVYDDVRAVDASAGRVALLAGGFPCQDVSVAGKRAGLQGERSGLFYEAIRIADELRPRAILFENVKGLFSSGVSRGADFAEVLDALADIGYVSTWRTLNSVHFGVPQRRERVFVLALAEDDPAGGRGPEVLGLAPSSAGHSPEGHEAWPYAARAAGERPVTGGAEFGRITHAVTSKWAKGSGGPSGDECQNMVLDTVSTLQARYHKGIDAEGAAGGQAVVFRKSRRAQSKDDCETWVEDNVSNTLNTFDTGDTRTTHAVVEERVRRLTPLECERLMGWPDNWTNVPWNKKDNSPDTRRYVACGNGVVSPITKWIGHRLLHALSTTN